MGSSAKIRRGQKGDVEVEDAVGLGDLNNNEAGGDGGVEV